MTITNEHTYEECIGDVIFMADYLEVNVPFGFFQDWATNTYYGINYVYADGFFFEQALLNHDARI